ncbi:MAG: ATPase, T2SS/T4P/T4SS family [Deltaproteobacteria bacterium]|nr:ATPase, T2SS/T4P/T4SS family [Deltaproteobacteria bacterium]
MSETTTPDSQEAQPSQVPASDKAPSSDELQHPLLRILHREFKVSRERLAHLDQEQSPGTIGLKALQQNLVVSRQVPPEIFQQAVARLYDLEYLPTLDDAEIRPEFTKIIPIRYAKKFSFFPLKLTDEALVVAVEDPEMLHPIRDALGEFGKPLSTVVTTHQSIISLINRAYERNQAETDEVIEGFDESMGDALGFGIEKPEDLIDARDEEPIKRLLNNMLYQAARLNASDVHIDSTTDEVVVRMRVDGVLHTISNLPKAVQRPLVNRIKIMSRLDISQHGLPQDGRTLILIAGRQIDIRVSTLPTVHGEKSVMRLLYQDQDLFNLRKLGMPEDIYKSLRNLLRQSGGIILVSGPTGSGKTTTLYAALGEIDRHSRNIMTIEDPVEYKLSGYVQTEVNTKLGLTFASALRSVLRQDPDVIMVGEMRDRETALIAIQAALTGHLVFSTVHTNSAAATVTRLVDMGVEPYLVSSTVMGVLAQRLVRKICSKCRAEVPSDPEILLELGLSKAESKKGLPLFQGKGCANCNGTGYKGRIGIYELLLVSDPVKKALLHSSEANVIREAAVKEGMMTMRRRGLELVSEGVTTAEEVMQATRED